MWFVIFFLAFAALIPGRNTQAFTHWKVTEKGLIYPRAHSPYDLARPYDLVGFVKQEDIYNNIIEHYQELTAQQDVVNKQWLFVQQSSNVMSFLDLDSDCEDAKRFYIEHEHLYPASIDSIRRNGISERDFSLHKYLVESKELPDCEKMSPLPFSMFAFEHLESMKNKDNLTIEPDFELQHFIFPKMSLTKFGSAVTNHLQRNESSWVHYVLASVYWKSVGVASKALECSRRAVHYAPRRFKDIALLSLGSILLRSRQIQDSHTLFSAAVDHGAHYAINHFALGYVYLLLDEVNSSLAHYDKSYKIDPSFEPVRNVRLYVKCYKKLTSHLDEVRNSLEELQSNITEYSAIEVKWWKEQSVLLHALNTNSQSFTELSKGTMDSICHTMGQIMSLDFCDVSKKGERSPDDLKRKIEDLQSMVVQSESLATKNGKIQRISHNLKRAKDFSPAPKKYKRTKTETDDEGPVELDLHKDVKKKENVQAKGSAAPKSNEFDEFQGGPILYPSTYKVDRSREDFDQSNEWPTAELCKEWSDKFPVNLDMVYPVFLPFENKGFKLKALLSKKIGVTLTDEHPLPWHPPVCKEVKGIINTTLPKLPKNHNVNSIPIDNLRLLLLNYVSDGNVESVQDMHEAEIGQRILTAHKKKVAPSWIIYTLSSLYWRVRRNNANALTCLASANRLVPAEHKDIIHVSLASVLLEAGLVEEALVFASQAFRISFHEPATNFILSLIHKLKNNHVGQIFHMRQVVRVEPDFMHGLARSLLYAWSCKFATSEKTKIESREQVCLSTGETFSCATEEESFTISSNLKHREYKLGEEISTIVRLLDLRPTARSVRDILSLKEELIADERERIAMAQIKLRYIMLDNILKNCGENDCSKLYPLKASDVTSEMCLYENLRLCYWQPYLGLESLLMERGIRIEMKTNPGSSSSRATLDCVAPPSAGDATLEWLARLDGAGWQPAGELVSEVASLVQGLDLADISATLAHHVKHSSSWLTLLVGGMWCGGLGRGACALRCTAAALHASPPLHRDIPLMSLFAILLTQDRVKDAKQAAYFALALAPKSTLHLFVTGISHTYMGEYSSAIRMFRLALTQNPEYAEARACLHANMCLLIYSDTHVQ